jgi:ketosteroid isomerase-like protein
MSPTQTTDSASGNTEIAALDAQLNQMILTGRAMEAFEQLYADDVVMQENSEAPRVGKDVNRKAEEEFFAGVAEWHDGKLVASAINGDTSFSEWYMDISFKNGMRVKSSQVAVRKWKNGKVAHERFFYNKG